MSLRRRAVASTSALFLSVGGMLGVAAPTATAGEHDGSCELLELCLFYNSDLAGAKHDFRSRVPDFGPFPFLGSGGGSGLTVKNNAASARNFDGYFTARIYYYSGYSGPADDVRPQAWRNLADTYNDNASMNWCYQQPLVCG